MNVFDFIAKKPVIAVELDSRLEHVAVSKDGKYLATSHEYGFVNVWDLEKQSKIFSKKIWGRVSFLSKEPTLVMNQGTVNFYEMPSGKWIGGIHDEMVSIEAISPDDDTFAGVGTYEYRNAAKKRIEKSPNGIHLYSRKQGRVVSTIKLEPNMRMGHLQFSPDGRFILACGGHGLAYIWDVSKIPPAPR